MYGTLCYNVPYNRKDNMQNIIVKEKIQQLERFNNLIKLMNKMSDNMQLMANRIVKLEQEVKRLNEKK
tara:strand:- start:37 stop:240 length:204 start_codon:yes stop_codon:yes gene_type:complete